MRSSDWLGLGPRSRLKSGLWLGLWLRVKVGSRIMVT
jgi:hypothetical protein